MTDACEKESVLIVPETSDPARAGAVGVLLPLNSQKLPAKPKDGFVQGQKSSSRLRRGDLSTALRKQWPWKVLSVCLDQQQSLARPPRSVPSISKFFRPGNVLLCVTEVFRPQVDHLSGDVVHYRDIQDRNLDRKGQEKPKCSQKYPEIST